MPHPLAVVRDEGDVLALVGEYVDADDTHILAEMPGFEPVLVARADGYEVQPYSAVFGF